MDKWLPSEKWEELPSNLGEMHHNFRKTTKVFDFLDIWLYYKRDLSEVQKSTNHDYLKNLESVLKEIDEKILQTISDEELGSICIGTLASQCLKSLLKMDVELMKSLLARFNFNLGETKLAVKKLFKAEYIEKDLPTNISLNVLFICRNLTLCGYPEGLIMAVLNMLDIKYAKNLHITGIIETALMYNTSCQALSKHRKEVSKPLNTSIDHINYFETITGSDLYAFGHGLFAYENLSRITRFKDIRQIHSVYLSKSTLSNSALGLLIDYRSSKNKDTVSIHFQEQELINNFYLNPSLGKLNKRSLADTNLMNILRLNQWQSDKCDYRATMDVDEDFWGSAQLKLGVKLLEMDRPYVTLYLRDNAFKGEPSGTHLNSDRNAKTSEYLELIKHIISLGYDVIRIGDKNQEELRINSIHYYEYNKSNQKNDLNDLFLIKNAKFCIVGGFGGGATAGDLFCKPTFYIDFPLARRGFFNPYAVHSPLEYFLNEEKLEIIDLFSLTPGGIHDGNALGKIGIQTKLGKRELIKTQITKFAECAESFNCYKKFKDTFKQIIIGSKTDNNREPILPMYIEFPFLISH